ncbi:hypothetical protein [Nocardia brasiliensis]|uniref:hypothetical protein n=1 Tax=Nocardia brasiliensis TaxID=37326 RepID=UPI0018955B7B|nr:hypothetical protein [Nocardia brasiliensis]MBF6131388.1 hypothetical protein [Nocardia brasiliensis]
MTDTANREMSGPDAVRSGAHRGSRSWRIVWMCSVAALFVVGVAAVPAWLYSSRFYRFDWIPVWGLAACWTIAVLLLAAPGLVGRREPGQTKPPSLVFAIVLGVAMVPVWSVSMFVTSFAAEDSKVVAVAISADGHHEVVTESYKIYNNPPGCRVLLRERSWLFSRQDAVWNEDVCPQHVSFTGDRTIEVVTESGETEQWKFDADQMQVDRIYRFR